MYTPTLPFRHLRLLRSSTRYFSALPKPSPSPQQHPDLDALVTQISQLSLSKTAALCTLLSQRLNITAPLPSAAQPQAATATSANQTETEEKIVIEKTEFKCTLTKFAPEAKAKVIREMKALLPGANLVEAKKFVEAAPKMIKEGMTKEDAEKMKATLEAVGATVTID